MDLFSNTLSFLLSGYGILNFRKDLQKLYFDYENIKESKVYTLSGLMETLKNSSDKSKVEYSKNNENEIIIKGFLEGMVQSNSFIKSTLKEGAKLVYKLNFLTKIHENDKFINHVNLSKQIPQRITKINQLPFFELKDYENNNLHCRIYKNISVIATQALSLIQTRSTIDNKISIFRRLLSFFYIFFQIISLFAEDKITYQGVKVGTCEVEMGIEINSFISVYGEIIYNLITKTFRIEKPEYFLKDKSFILDELTQKIKRKRLVVIFYIIMNFYCGIKLFRKLWDLISKMYRKKTENSNFQLRNLEKFRLCEPMKCVICYQQVRNIILTPCKHLAICHLCLKNIKISKQCPICKDRFHSFIELFTK